MERPLVSVIIPTRNRQAYAVKTVKQILGLNAGIEIILQDNSDDEAIYGELKTLIEGRKIKYQYEKKVLSFSENYNRAAEQVTGRYLCAIGDDDGILPNIVDCAKWMDEKGIDAVKPAKDQVYFYPGNSNRKRNACIGYGVYTGAYFFSKPESSMIALLNDGGCNYLEKDLPGSYHGLVRMEAMDEIRRITGKYYGGLTPDMYSVACLSLLSNMRFAILDYPISLPGVCPTSGSAQSDSGKHVGKLEDAPHLKALPDYVWSDCVPRYYSVETIWAETMIYAIRRMGRDELIGKYYNPGQLARHLYVNNRAHRGDILNALPKEMADYVCDCCRVEAQGAGNRLSNVLELAAIKMSGKRKVVRNVADIEAAVDIMNRELKQQKARAPWD